MTNPEFSEMMRKLLADNPLAMEMMRMTQDTMIEVAEIFTEGGRTVEINGKTVTPEDAKRARAEFGPKIVYDDEGPAQ
jgi:hypothetical protein